MLEPDCLNSHPGFASNWNNLCKLDSVYLSFPIWKKEMMMMI